MISSEIEIKQVSEKHQFSWEQKILQIFRFAGFSYPHIQLLWRWRESNPRPNEEAICFLHAYPQTWFSNKSWIRATDFYLILLSFAGITRKNSNYPRYTCTTGSSRFRAVAPGWCLVPAPSAGIKCNLLSSITQQERSYFRQLWFERRD